ncbi:thyrotropin subunit beta-like [Platichthys flesus]|uniref:thyrotropin subunit beta-like n=1 Tax=Platichthys flesus TaxID=8260 RepID=UPI002DBE761B|nr:thyrotropin subunit beta-like [Platichthys flesus]
MRRSMPLFVSQCILLCVLMGGTVCACMLKNHTLWIERHDCAQCVAINTTICSGYCYTQDTNFKGRFGRTFLIQRSCVPLSLVYRPACFPGCSKDAAPQVYYPVARCCSCKRCDTRTHNCVRTGQNSYDQCPKTHGSVKYQNQSASEMSQDMYTHCK